MGRDGGHYGPSGGGDSFRDVEKERKRLKKERKELDRRDRKRSSKKHSKKRRRRSRSRSRSSSRSRSRSRRRLDAPPRRRIARVAVASNRARASDAPDAAGVASGGRAVDRRDCAIADRRAFYIALLGASIRYFRPRSIARANSRTVNAHYAPASRRHRARVAAVRRSVGRAVARSRGRAATAHRATTTTTRETTTR